MECENGFPPPLRFAVMYSPSAIQLSPTPISGCSSSTLADIMRSYTLSCSTRCRMRGLCVAACPRVWAGETSLFRRYMA